EEGVECCYARQSKFRLHDPDGTLWEFYVLEEDIAHRGAGQALEVIQGHAAPLQPSNSTSAVTSQLAKVAGEWEHQLGREFPAAIPHSDASLSEVRLRGTFNASVSDEEKLRILAEVRRVLTENGRLVLHQLTADRPVKDELVRLPGPASVVRQVPMDKEVVDALL